MDKVILENFVQTKNYQHSLSLSPSVVAKALLAYPFLGEEQLNAVMNTCTTGVISAVIGYAGTGKTTTSKTILNILLDELPINKNEIVCCALSGVAANRIKQQSGFASFTIHSLLGWEGTGFVHNAKNKLTHKIIVLDETSMVDTYLFYSLIQAIDFVQTKLILLGDTEQLSPVGAGQPFTDAVNNELITCSRLTKIFRQSDDKAITLIAQDIRNGKMPMFKSSYSDVANINIPSGERDVTNKTIEQVLAQSSELYAVKSMPSNDEELIKYIYDFQVITPRRTGTLGSLELSYVLREVLSLNKEAKAVFADMLPIRPFEKVIHLKNENMKTSEGDEVRVFNGQIGVVVNVDYDNEEITVRYPIENYNIVYNDANIKAGMLTYAWALTVHKTQGAEFKNVFIPLTNSHWNMLNNRLLYTAITRAKDSVTLIGEGKALWRAATNNESIIRITTLSNL